jgi:hypothetical protein
MPSKDKIGGKNKQEVYNNGSLNQNGSECVNVYCIDWKSGAVLYLKNPYLLQMLGVICVCVCVRAHVLACPLSVFCYFIHAVVLHQDHSLFQSTFSTGCDLVLPLSVSNIVMSSSSRLCLLLCLPITYILSSIFSSVMCFRRQFLHKKWPVQLAFFLFIVCRIFLSYCYLLSSDNCVCWIFECEWLSDT